MRCGIHEDGLYKPFDLDCRNHNNIQNKMYREGTHFIATGSVRATTKRMELKIFTKKLFFPADLYLTMQHFKV